MTKPIAPNKVLKIKQSKIPDVVFQSFNELIVENWDGQQSIIEQNAIVDRILKHSVFNKQDIFDKKWLDVEDCFRAVGWKVEYDKPGFMETYPPTFIFYK